MVKDATADYSDREMQASLEVNIPNYASAIVTADEIVAAISALADAKVGVAPDIGFPTGPAGAESPRQRCN